LVKSNASLAPLYFLSAGPFFIEKGAIRPLGLKRFFSTYGKTSFY
jgi:hypothetical protein